MITPPFLVFRTAVVCGIVELPQAGKKNIRIRYRYARALQTGTAEIGNEKDLLVDHLHVVVSLASGGRGD